MALCLYVTSQCSIEVVGQIDLVSGMEASSFDQFYIVLRKFKYLQKIRVLPPELFPKLRT